jgi:hypothetical protein
MQAYEIRILGKDHRRLRSIRSVHLSNNAATRAAYSLADGRSFEIWQEGRCIYGTDGVPAAWGENGNDIYGTACKMSELYDERAAMTAAQRAHAALAKSDFRGFERWRLIMAALRNMERRRNDDPGRPKLSHPPGRHDRPVKRGWDFPAPPRQDPP